MFINDHVVFLQLDKTASTHISDLLHRISPGDYREKHSQLKESPGGRRILGSVRNPWDWYVSLWAYGCGGRGKIYRQLVRSFPQVSHRLVRRSALHPGDWGNTATKLVSHFGKDHEYWRRVYASADDPELFREWLRGIMSDEGKSLLLGEYPHLPMRAFTGFLTYRFLYVFVDAASWRQYAHRIRTPEALESYYHEHCVVERFIRMESLEQDLISILDDLGVRYDPEMFGSRERTNPSKHKSTAHYYDEETIDLVRQNDHLIITEFGYEPPR